jgi:hypothetical protein
VIARHKVRLLLGFEQVLVPHGVRMIRLPRSGCDQDRSDRAPVTVAPSIAAPDWAGGVRQASLNGDAPHPATTEVPSVP